MDVFLSFHWIWWPESNWHRSYCIEGILIGFWVFGESIIKLPFVVCWEQCTYWECGHDNVRTLHYRHSKWFIAASGYTVRFEHHIFVKSTIQLKNVEEEEGGGGVWVGINVIYSFNIYSCYFIFHILHLHSTQLCYSVWKVWKKLFKVEINYNKNRE